MQQHDRKYTTNWKITVSPAKSNTCQPLERSTPEVKIRLTIHPEHPLMYPRDVHVYSRCVTPAGWERNVCTQNSQKAHEAQCEFLMLSFNPQSAGMLHRVKVQQHGMKMGCDERKSAVVRAEILCKSGWFDCFWMFVFNTHLLLHTPNGYYNWKSF